MREEPHHTVHTLPFELLQTRAREALRLIEQARAVVRAQFADGERQPDSTGAQQVGAMLDAVERLLPGVSILAVQYATDTADPEHRESTWHTSSRTIAKETSHHRAERESTIRGVVINVAALLGEIERGRACVVRVPEALESSRDFGRRR